MYCENMRCIFHKLLEYSNKLIIGNHYYYSNTYLYGKYTIYILYV